MPKPVQTPDEFFSALGEATKKLEGQSSEPSVPAQTTVQGDQGGQTEPTVPTTQTTPEGQVAPEGQVTPEGAVTPEGDGAGVDPKVKPNEPEGEGADGTDHSNVSVEPEGAIDDWDVEPTTTVDTISDEIYAQLGKELGVDGLTKEKLVEVLNQSNKQDAPIIGIPDDLAVLVNLARSGVDYKEYISLKNANYSAYDDKTLVEHSIRDAMKDAEGKLSPDAQEQISQYMEDLTEMDLKIRGNQIRNHLETTRNSRIQQIESQSHQLVQNRESELKSSLDNFNEVAGFKVQPHQKKSAFDRISSGDAVANLIYKPDGTYDYDKIVKLDFVINNLEKMVDYHRQRAHTDTKRKMINERANVNTGVTQTLPAPDVPKPKDGLDTFIQWAKELNDPNKGGLFGKMPST